jgi:hypothetical protein
MGAWFVEMWVLTHSSSVDAWAVLAKTYYGLSRHEDALLLQHKILDFNRRVFPENHHQIGPTQQ